MHQFGPAEDREGRSLTRSEAMQALAAKYDRFGYSKAQIAERLGVSDATVDKLLARVRAAYKAAKLLDRDALIREKLELLRDVRMEAAEEWQRSRRDFEKRVQEKVDKGDYTQEKWVQTVEGRLATAEYMRIVLDTVKQERELLGLDAPTRQEHHATLVNIDWEALYRPPQVVLDGAQVQLGHANPVEAALLLAEQGKIREAEALAQAVEPSKGADSADLPVAGALAGPTSLQEAPPVGALDEELPPPLSEKGPKPAKKPRKRPKKG